MEMKTKILLLVLVLSISCSVVSADLIEVSCICMCNGKEMSALGTAHKELLGGVFGSNDYMRAMEACQKQCAATCGSLADCSGENILHPDALSCEECCSNHCGDYNWVYPPPDMTGYEWHYPPSELDYYKGFCMKSCRNSCELKETVGEITEVIYYIAGIVAAIMFIIAAYKIIVSSTPEDRSDAKNGVMCVILALMIIAIADPLANLLIGEMNIEPAAPTFEPSTEEIGGIILDDTVHHAYVAGDEIKIHATVMNNGNKLGKFYILYLYGKDGTQRAHEPDLLALDLGPGQKGSLTITSEWSIIAPWNIYDLQGGYYLWLGDAVDENKYDRYPDTGTVPV